MSEFTMHPAFDAYDANIRQEVQHDIEKRLSKLSNQIGDIMQQSIDKYGIGINTRNMPQLFPGQQYSDCKINNPFSRSSAEKIKSMDKSLICRLSIDSWRHTGTERYRKAISQWCSQFGVSCTSRVEDYGATKAFIIDSTLGTFMQIPADIAEAIEMYAKSELTIYQVPAINASTVSGIYDNQSTTTGTSYNHTEIYDGNILRNVYQDDPVDCSGPFSSLLVEILSIFNNLYRGKENPLCGLVDGHCDDDTLLDCIQNKIPEFCKDNRGEKLFFLSLCALLMEQTEMERYNLLNCSEIKKEVPL